jgi:tetratricopeptide (TPR) repeat protein
VTEKSDANLLGTLAGVLEKADKYASIIAAAIAALTFSQGNRTVSYVFVIIGWALMSSFMWRIIRQKSEAQREISVPDTPLRHVEYTYSRSERWIAGFALIILTTFSFSWVGVNGWQDYQAWCHVEKHPFCPKPELLVLVAQFGNKSTKGVDPTQRIYDRLQRELEDTGTANATLQMIPEITERNEARRIGERRGALFVIWGWFDDIGFSPHFTVIEEEGLALKDLELEEVPVEPSKDFSLYIREGLPSQMAYFSTLTVGQVYYLDGEFEKALRAFDRAVENAEKSGTTKGLDFVYFYRGYIHQGAFDDLEAAINDYSRIIELRERPITAYYNRGTLYYHIAEYDLAIADYDAAIDLAPGFVQAYRNRGAVYYYMDEFDLAIADYSEAIDLRPRFAETYNDRGFVYYHKDEFDLAIADYKKAIKLKPDYAWAYNNLCWCYALDQKPKTAMPYCQQAVEIDSDPRIRDSRGVAYALLGNYPAAIEDFQSYIEWLEQQSGNRYQAILARRNDWIKTLRDGQNPFTPEVLQKLQSE